MSVVDVGRGNSVARIARDPVKPPAVTQDEVTWSMLKRKWRGGDACFTTLPRSVLWPPPIQHRHTAAERHYVSPFELSVLGALLIEARRSWYQDMYRQCMEAGAERIKQQQGKRGTWRGEWGAVAARRKAGESKAEAEAPTCEFAFPVVVDLQGVGYPGGPIVDAMDSDDAYQPMKLRKMLSDAGKWGYHQKSVELEKQGPPKLVNIELARTKILKLAALPTNGINLAKVDQALERLTHQVAELAAPVVSCQEPEATRLQLKILGEWLKPPFVMVPLPLPTRTLAATALYLMMWQLEPQRRRSKNGLRHDYMLYTKFCAMLGIPLRRGGQTARQTLGAAVDVVNEHLEKKLPRKRLEHTALTLPDVLQIKRVDDDHVRIHTIRADDFADSGGETGHQKRQREEAEKKEREKIETCRAIAAAGEAKVKAEQEKKDQEEKAKQEHLARRQEEMRQWEKDLLIRGDRVKPGQTFGSLGITTLKRLARDPKFDQDQ